MPPPVLLLKLALIPLAVLALGIMERLHGPRVAGWLSGFPVVAFPLLLFVTLDHGGDFGSASALGAWYGLVAWLSFAMTYSWCSRRLNWFWCIVISFAVWTVMALVMLEAQQFSVWTELLPVAAFVVALLSYPRGAASDEQREHRDDRQCTARKYPDVETSHGELLGGHGAAHKPSTRSEKVGWVWLIRSRKLINASEWAMNTSTMRGSKARPRWSCSMASAFS